MAERDDGVSAPDDGEDARVRGQLHTNRGTGPTRVAGDAARARESIEAYEREVESTIDPRRRAALYYEIGRIHETQFGDDRHALAFYQRAHRCDPKHVASLRAARHIFARSARWSAVLHLLEAELRASRSPKRRIELLLEKADLYLARFENFAAARECYVGVLELEPLNRAASRALCNVAALLDQPTLLAESLEAAAASCRDARHRASLLVEAAQARCRAHLDDDSRRKASDDLREALEVQPGHVAAGELLARLLRDQEDWSGILDLGESQAEHIDDPALRADHLTELARVALYALEDAERARRYLEQALSGPGATPHDLETLIDLQLDAAMWSEATEGLQRLVAVTRDKVSRVRLLSRLADIQLRKMENENAAIETLRAVLALDPTWLPALKSLGAILGARGAWRDLVAMHEAELEFVTDNRQRANKLFKIGDLLENRIGDLQAASEAYRQAIDLTPGFLHAVKACGRVLAELGDWESYVDLLRAEAEIAEDVATRVYCFERIADCYATRLDQPRRAIEPWQRVLDLAPDHIEAIRSLARLYAREAMWRELVEMNDAEIRLVRDDATILTLLVRNAEICDRDLDDTKRTDEYLERALDIGPRYLPALQARGRLYQSEGRWADLIAMYEREIEVSHAWTDVVNLHFKIGEIWRDQLDDADAAIRAFEEALRLSSDHLPTLHALQRLFAERGDARREAELIQMEAEYLNDPSEQARLSCRLGDLFARRLDDPVRAVEAWRRALQLENDHRPALTALARHFEETGDDEQLVEVLKRMADVGPTRAAAVEAWMRVGRICLNRLDRSADAIQAFDSALTLQPDHLDGLLALERVYLATHDLSELAFVYGRLGTVVDDSAAQVDFLLARGRLHEGLLSKPGMAVADYRAVLDIDPQCNEAMERLELLAKTAGDRGALARVLGRQLEAVEEPAQRAALLVRRADLLREAGQSEDAIACYEAVVELDDESLPAVRALRELYVELDRAPEALYMAEREGRLTADPHSASSLLLAAARIRESRIGDHEGALANYREALERDPGADEAASGFRRLAERAGQWEHLVDVLKGRAEALPERHVELMQEVATIYARRLNRPEQAVRILNQVLTRATDRAPAVLQQLADLYADQEQWGEAAAVYERLRETSTDDGLRRAITFRLAAIYEKKQPDPARARKCLDDILLVEPDNVDALLRRAAQAETEDDIAGAFTLLRRALAHIEDARRRADLLMRIGRLAETVGDVPAAIDAYREALQHNPDDTAAVQRLGTLYAQAHRGDELFELFERALAALPPRRKAERIRLRRKLGELCLLHLGDARRAAGELQLLIDRETDDVEARGLLARALSQLGDEVDRATSHYQWLLDRDPLAVESLRAMRALSERAGQFDRAYQISVFLNCLNAASDEEQETIRRWLPRRVRWPCRALEASDYDLLRSGREIRDLDTVLFAVVDSLPTLFYTPPGVGTNDVNTADLDALARRIGHVLGAREACAEIDTSLNDGVRYTDGDPERVVFGAGAVSRMSSGEHSFHLARGIMLGHRRLAALTRWTPFAVRVLFETLARPDGRSSPGGGDAADDLERRVNAARSRLSRKSRRALATHLDLLEQLLPSLDVESAFAGYMETANRTALLLCGGVVPAVDVLRKSVPEWRGGGRDTPTVVARLRQVPGVVDLARWIIGDAYYVLRDHVGMALNPE